MFHEKLICDSRNTDLEIKNLINANQYGIMKSRSCQKNLIAFFDKITGLLDKGNCADIVYMDFSKAFDTALHD